MPNADIVTPFWLIQQTCRLVTMCPAGGCRQLIDTPGRHRTFPVMNSKMTTTHPVGDPRHTFLKPQEVIARYRWGRTRGYLELKKPTFPRPIGGQYRLDTLMAWEEWCLTLHQPCQRESVAAIALLEPVPAPSFDSAATPTHDGPAELPQRSQSRRRRTA
jgi:hypothetical protein